MSLVGSSESPLAKLAASALKPVVRAPTRERISDRVHQELVSAIRSLRLRPGATISETELSQQLGVSRTPLREALSRLVDQRLVIVESQVGTTVSLIDLAEVEEVCFVRCALETAAFANACKTRRGDVGGLRRILARQEQAVADKDGDAFFVSDEELHQEIFRLAGYPNVWTMVQGSKLQLDRLRWLIMPEALAHRDVVDEHGRMVDLLEAGDIEAGSALIAQHSLHILNMAPNVRAEHPDYFTT